MFFFHFILFKDDQTGFTDLSHITNKSKMLSLEQIIELYDEQLTNETKSATQNNKKKKNNKRSAEDATFHFDHQTSREQKTVNFMVKNRTNKLNIGKKLYEFYNAPVTKFWQNTIFYMIFLVTFAYIVLVKTPKRPSYPEIFVLVYLFTYGLDKVRELLQTDSTRFSGKIKIFFSNIMNSLDAFFILTIMASLFYRFSSFDDDIKTARLLYCVNTIYWYIKLLEYLIINKYTGPLIIIASRMVTIISFTFLFLFFYSSNFAILLIILN